MYVIMKKAPETVGGWVLHKRWEGTLLQAEKYCDEANGMVLSVWDKDKYDKWYADSIAHYYQ